MKAIKITSAITAIITRVNTKADLAIFLLLGWKYSVKESIFNYLKYFILKLVVNLFVFSYLYFNQVILSVKEYLIEHNFNLYQF